MFLFQLKRRQAVRQRILIPPCGGSNPPAPANLVTSFEFLERSHRCGGIQPQLSAGPFELLLNTFRKGLSLGDLVESLTTATGTSFTRQ